MKNQAKREGVAIKNDDKNRNEKTKQKMNKIEHKKITQKKFESNKIQTFDTLNIQEVLNIKIDIINKKNINTLIHFTNTLKP